MAKNEKMFSKVVMIVLLSLFIIGFMVPGFINNQEDPYTFAEPRLCRTDADCYLTCDDQPVEVLCSQNLCVQNACDEGNSYPYRQQPVSFSLEIATPQGTVDLPTRSSSQDLFVRFEEKVKVYSASLPLALILEKAMIQYDGYCLAVDGTQYCSNGIKNITTTINGENNALSPYYVPEEGDSISIIYS
ncbi:hypothetical protein COV20_05785 [Candidatus Woesearchaeota archaeon CG10_big_fil_rev_8_21_14_0_10_45_16]|nr:MAG: hypothetical protein COV20_05785 [Candidatus Woesearchaeota archaeon CG10_big_fil_rev_8_21_14_0_10_45_16]